MPPRILFAIGRGGGGHKASARAVRDALPAGLRDSVEFCDFGYALEACIWGGQPRSSGFDCDEVYNLLLRFGFTSIASVLGHIARLSAYVLHGPIVRGLTRMWSGPAKPDVVVSFVPYFNAVMRDALGVINPNASLVTVVTDFASSAEHWWIDEAKRESAVRHVIVAGTPTLQRQCAELGYAPTDVLASSGMVVHPSFHRAAPSAADDDESSGAESANDVMTMRAGEMRSRCDEREGGCDRALISFGAFPPMRVEHIVNALAHTQPQLELVVLCGGNDALLNRLRARGNCVAEPMISSQRVRDHMRQASFVIGKPGPGTVSEASVSGAAFVSERKGVMAQERLVLDWIDESGAGVVVDDLTRLPPDLCERVRRCRPTVRANAAANRAVFEVRDLVTSLLAEAGRGREWADLECSRKPALQGEATGKKA